MRLRRTRMTTSYECAQFRAYRALGRAIGRTIPAATKELNPSTAVSGPEPPTH